MKKETRENLKVWLLSYLHTAGQSLRKVGVNVALCVTEHILPQSDVGMVWLWGFVGSHSVIRQVGLKKHADS